MTEATKGLLHVVGGRWVWDANGPVASDETAGVTVATTVTGINDADYETQQANAELIVKRWNAHDALVEALETALNTETAARIGSESGAMQGFDYKYHYAKIRTALEAAK